MNQIDTDNAAFFRAEKLDLEKLMAPFDGDGYSRDRDHGECSEEQVLREVAAISTSPEYPDWLDQVRYVKREVMLVGLPEGGGGMVSAHEWDDWQWRVLNPTMEEGDELDWVERLLEVNEDSADEEVWSEGFISAENVLAALAGHPEACDYTIKATALEVRDHLIDLVRRGEEARERERRLCGGNGEPVLSADEEDVQRKRAYKLAIVEW